MKYMILERPFEKNTVELTHILKLNNEREETYNRCFGLIFAKNLSKILIWIV